MENNIYKMLESREGEEPLTLSTKYFFLSECYKTVARMADDERVAEYADRRLESLSQAGAGLGRPVITGASEEESNGLCDEYKDAADILGPSVIRIGQSSCTSAAEELLKALRKERNNVIYRTMALILADTVRAGSGDSLRSDILRVINDG